MTLAPEGIYPSVGRPSPFDWLAILALASLAVWLFRGHVFGDSLWIGNPDRLNGDFKYLRHYLLGLNQGGIEAWNEHEMMGYDSLGMAGTSPNPLVYLLWLLANEKPYISMGYVAVGMLVVAGVAAYGFLRSIVPAGLPVVVGAICYEFSTLTILKLSQNSMSFAVFIVIPLLALSIRWTRRETSAWCFVALTALIGAMLNYMFLQKAAYALMLAGTYSAWRSHSLKTWRPLLVFMLAALAATALSFPRVLTVGMALSEFRRAVDGVDLKSFDALYRFQNIYPYELLRWLDASFFGRYPSDAQSIGNNMNLTEGFLLSTSTLVPVLLLIGLFRNPPWASALRSKHDDSPFFFWILVACVSVIAFKPGAYAIYLLFLRLDFTHARVLIAALLPMAALVALTLENLSPKVDGASRIRYALIGCAVGALTMLAIEVLASKFDSTISLTTWLDLQIQAPNAREEALVRICLSLVALGALLMMRLAKAGQVRQIAHAALCASIISQCLIAANNQVNGAQTRNFEHPFHAGDFYYAKRDEFALPTKVELDALHRRIEPQRYRVGFICDERIADGFCAGHIPEFWQLRSIDGYYGPGVPRRLRALPWPGSVSLRTISFTRFEAVPWDLLGLLNVRWILSVSDGVFRNVASNGGKISDRPDPSTFALIASPARITPRAFFAAEVRPAASPEDAAARLFGRDGVVDPTRTSFVEGLTEARSFAAEGAVTIEGQGDSLQLHFNVSNAERFLVLNELYYPGWSAQAAGRQLDILATNAVMRGVVVPRGVSSVRFEYSSFVNTAVAWGIRIGALALALALLLVLRRFEK